MKLFKRSSLFSLVLAPLAAVSQAAEASTLVTVDKGSLVLELTESGDDIQYSVTKKSGCEGEVKLERSAGRFTFMHTRPNECPSGAVINVKLRSQGSVTVQHGGGIVTVLGSARLKNDYSLDLLTAGGLIQGNLEGLELNGYGVPTQARSKNAKSNRFTVRLSGGVIQLK